MTTEQRAIIASQMIRLLSMILVAQLIVIPGFTCATIVRRILTFGTKISVTSSSARAAGTRMEIYAYTVASERLRAVLKHFDTVDNAQQVPFATNARIGWKLGT